MRRVAFGIGSNLGDRRGYLQLALDRLVATPGITLLAVSPLYETDPVGGPEQPDFLNGVVLATSDLTPHELLAVAQSVEAVAQRVRVERWGPRTLDVDIVLIEGLSVNEPDLVVPHPRAKERGFVLRPLGDVAPDLARTLGPDGRWPGVRPSPLELVLPI